MTTARLAAQGIRTLGDLLMFLPRGYDDQRRVYALSALAAVPEGTTVVVRGTVRRVHVFPHRLMDVHLEQDGASLRARWFRPGRGMSKAYPKGGEVALAGAVRWGTDGGAELVHPTNVTSQLANSNGGLGIRPRYPKVQGVPGRTVEKLVAASLDRCIVDVVDPLPAVLRHRLKLAELSKALTSVHRPASSLDEAALNTLASGQSEAHRRLAFDEAFVVQLALRRARNRTRTDSARPCRAVAAAVLSELRAQLPFVLTGAQGLAIAAIFADLSRPFPMQRLLQGDVGSGKTAVALAASALVARSGCQVLLMAPTEILAEQHAAVFTALGAGLGLRVGLLTGSLKPAQRQAVLARAATGDLDVLIGTHALLDGRVILPALALAIVDEQQRFGVRQRARLGRTADLGSPATANAGILPHLLVLSATPIPRTLALTLYGDLDLTTLDELPPGRTPVVTTVCVGDDQQARAYAAVAQAVAAGRQAFIVCPTVGTGAGPGSSISVNTHAARLSRSGILKSARIGVVHGQLDRGAQERVLGAFRAGSLDILVATTVIEVGLDVPRASVMVVEDAERFGLAQLHQLRGRVGRGTETGSCWLCTCSAAPEAGDRLRVLAATTDGFRIAEEDLRLRGPGDIHGAEQSGAPRFRFGDFAGHVALLDAARVEAERLLSVDPELSSPIHQALRRAVDARWAERPVFAEEAG